MEFDKKVIVDVDGVIETGKQFDLDLKLPEDDRNVIYGIIKDHKGKPVADAVVKLVEVCKDERKAISHSFTDKEGEFVFGPLCPNKSYAVEIWVNRVKHVKICKVCEHEGRCLKGVDLRCEPHFFDKDDKHEEYNRKENFDKYEYDKKPKYEDYEEYDTYEYYKKDCKDEKKDYEKYDYKYDDKKDEKCECKYDDKKDEKHECKYDDKKDEKHECKCDDKKDEKYECKCDDKKDEKYECKCDDKKDEKYECKYDDKKDEKCEQKYDDKKDNQYDRYGKYDCNRRY